MARTYVHKNKLQTMNVEEAIREGISSIRAVFKDPDVSNLDKAKIAVPLVSKYIPTKISGELKGEVSHVVRMETIKINGKKLEFEIGD